jgi:hypothetical protein
MPVRDDRVMMTQQLGASILCAPLAAIDRRALSQAWYSALRLAREPHAPATPAPVRPQQPESAARPDLKAAVTPWRRGVVPERAGSASVGSRPSGPVAESAADRRALRSRLARDIQRALLDPRSALKRATFTIGREGARVHVVLQTRGDRVCLVAFCPPAQRASVARALAQARFALASRGIVVNLETRGTEQCS